MFTRDYEEKSLGALILALDDGLSVYCSVNRNFVSIKLSFSQCTYMTATTAVEELMAYIADLDRDICREPLCLDLDEMAGEDYWMRKLAKLRSDIEELDGLELLQHDLVWGYKGFFPKSTTELYRGIEQKAREVAGLLDQVLQKTSEKHLSFYDRFYRDQRAQYNDEKAVADFKNWLRSSGIPSLDKFKTFRAEEIIRFLKGGTLECASEPSVEEWEKVNVEQFKRQVPLSCQEEEWFRKCFDRLLVIFNRTVSWEGDILVPNYACAGLFIFQHWDQLTEKEIQAIFYLDKTLELIHQDMVMILSNGKSDNTASVEDRIRRCIALLMAERLGDEPLFNQQNHWQAVYRILVDKGYCSDSDFDGFDAFIRRVMPEEVNKPYSKGSLKQISQTDFVRPFNEWKYDVLTSKTRKPYDRMVAVTRRFLEILEENGL